MTPKPQVYGQGARARALQPEAAASDGERVVISGMSGLFPQSHNVKELSEILYNKDNPITPNPRWKYNHPEAANYTGNLPDLEKFDAQFFKVHYRLANCMDSMGRKVLEQSYQAIYDAGISPEHLNGKKVGVYIGSCFSETEKVCFYVASSRTGFGIAGCSKSMFANRISYWLNAKGPSMAVDEACCSSLAALEQAYLDITRGECEAAIVGGANLCFYPQSSVHYARIMKMSPDGRTKSFDAHADGCTRSEAISVLFLQRAKNAKRIYADVLHVKNEFTQLLQGEAGPKYGPYRHSKDLAQFIRQFYKEAKVSPNAVEYVEAFGSAVPEADKAELEAIEDVFCKDRKDQLLVGSVMSNIGYSEAASGISAITKVLLAYQRGELAANLHCENPRRDVAALQDGRMRIVTEHQKFARSYAAVNSLSVTGVNAHALLHGHYKPKDPNRYKSSIPRLVTISARQDKAVARIFEDLKSRPVDPEEIALFHNIHETSITGHMGRGYIILSTDAESKTASLAEKWNYFDDAKRPLWFVYSGMGSQWAGMGSELMRIPVFAAAIERCRKVLEPKGVDIVHIITSPDKTIFDNILHSFVGIAAVQIGLTDVLTSVGIKPDMIIGHSVGELGCAYADGCLTAEEMILSAYSRGLVSVQTPFVRGSMAAVGVGYQQVSKLVPPEIEVACHNAPESSTISGPADAMREFVATLTAQGIFAKEVPCSNIAYHSRYIAEAGPGLLKYLKEVIKDPKPRTARWVSTSVPEDRWNEPLAKTSSAEYHTNNLLNPVLFEETSRLIPANAVLVEIAPHGLLQAILKRSLPESCRNIPLTRRGHPDNVVMVLDAIGNLYMEGYNPKINALYPQVEFPVSTGTPMLSHLVDWAHGEVWPLPLYMSAHRKTAASRKFVLSIHDEEHKYLQGNVIRGQNIYPFSAALIAAWDTLAMTLQVKRKELSVEFHDVQLFSQPALHDQRQLRLSVAMQRGTGKFEILDENRKVATGMIVPLEIKKDAVIGTIEPLKSNEDTDLNADDVYQMLYERNYAYSGDFKSIYRTNISLNKAQIIWNQNWVTFLDGLLQFNTLRREYDDTSYTQTILRIRIDVNNHLRNIENVGDKAVVTADASDLDNNTRCGGVLIEWIQFKDLPPLSSDLVALKSLKFVPRFQHNINAANALQIYLQIVSENINKESIKVLRIVNKGDYQIFYDIENTINDGFGIKVQYEQVVRDDVLTKRDSFLTEVDVILVQNLSINESLCQLLYRLLPRDAFIINGGCTGEERNRPSTLYNVLSSLIANRTKLELIRWRPTQSTLASTIVTVKTPSDLAMLKSTQATLPPKHKLVILSSYPALAELKDLVKQWRKEAEKNQVYLAMISEKDNLEQLPEFDLVYNVLQNGVWGGEHHLPCEEIAQARRGVTLLSRRIGDLDSLYWVEAVEPTGSGIPVTVHYVGLSDIDAKKASGVVPLTQDNEVKCSYGMSFSGVTDNGMRVMGVAPTGAAFSRVRAAAELLWPVPDHWSLEDAATVPAAYMQAFYCLAMKVKFQRGLRVLVHGGAGALGQAVISVALASRCDVFATVSDIRKKRFLLRLFPNLKEDHIGNSRDHTFSDMVMLQTKGKGCDIVICCVKGDLKNASFKCTGQMGIILDVVQISSREMFSFGMENLTQERNYVKVDFCTIFGHHKEMKQIQSLIWEGISRGYVRPLSRVTYAPHEAPRAFRLLANSRHRGRVLIQMPDTSVQAPTSVALPRISCSPDMCQLVICNKGTFGLLVAERLIQRGATKLLLHFNKIPKQLQLKIKSWKEQIGSVQVSTEDLSGNKGVVNVLQDSNRCGPVEGIHVIATHVEDLNNVTAVIGSLDTASRKLCPALRYFTVIASGTLVGHPVCYSRIRDGLPAKSINISSLKVAEDIPSDEVLSHRAAIEAVERALCSEQGAGAVAAHVKKAGRPPLLWQIARVADIEIPDVVEDQTTLIDMGLELVKVPAIISFLSDTHNVSYSEDVIPTLTVQQIRELEETIFDSGFKNVKGLSTFYNYVDSDELLATTETVFLQTLTNNATMRDDEFDMSRQYLSILPGLEGHHERFRVLCERLKLPALVLQPGLDHDHETFEERAKRHTTFLQKKTKLHDKFYLLGYETGVNVALEMAAILEEQGLTGTVFLLGGTPVEVQALLEDRLSEYETEDALAEGVENHIRNLSKQVTHSAQYARSLTKSAQEMLKRARLPCPTPKELRSKIVLLRASDISPLTSNSNTLYSKMAVHNLRAPLAFAASDLRCAAIVNSYLDEEVLKAFEEKNLCETYLLNADTYMTLVSTHEKSDVV